MLALSSFSEILTTSGNSFYCKAFVLVNVSIWFLRSIVFRISRKTYMVYRRGECSILLTNNEE